MDNILLNFFLFKTCKLQTCVENMQLEKYWYLEISKVYNIIQNNRTWHVWESVIKKKHWYLEISRVYNIIQNNRVWLIWEKGDEKKKKKKKKATRRHDVCVCTWQQNCVGLKQLSHHEPIYMVQDEKGERLVFVKWINSNRLYISLPCLCDRVGPTCIKKSDSIIIWG